MPKKETKEEKAKRMAMAKVGLVALIDEATKYQEVRPKDELAKLAKKYYDEEVGEEKPHWQCQVCERIYVTIPIPEDFICPLCKGNRE